MEKDEGLREVIGAIGWVHRVKIHTKPYYNKRLSLDIEDGCLWCNRRLVIPITIRTLIFNTLHDSHIGIVKPDMVAKNRKRY